MAYRRTEQTSHRLAARRQAILTAARGIVSDVGFHGLNMKIVAEAAGVATGTLYRYFPSKASLCIEIVTGTSERELVVLRRIAASDDAPIDRLWSAINTFSRRAMQARRLAYSLMAEPVEPELDRLRIHYREALSEILVGLIEESVAADTLPKQNAAARAAFMVGAFIEGVVGPHAPDLPLAARGALSDDIASFCLRGAGATAQSLAARGRALDEALSGPRAVPA